MTHGNKSVVFLSTSKPLVRLIAIVVLVCSTNIGMAKGRTSSMSRDFDYPELLVTPLASETLRAESRAERKQSWLMHIPIQSAAITTLLAATFTQLSRSDFKGQNTLDQLEYAANTGYVVGGAWLAMTLALSATYHPYTSGNRNLRGMSKKNKRLRLLRERTAEEALYAPSSFGKKLKYLATISIFSTNFYMAVLNHQRLPKVFCGVGALLSFAPLLFPYSWEKRVESHESYKKRIYGPIATQFIFDPWRQQAHPAIIGQITF